MNFLKSFLNWLFPKANAAPIVPIDQTIPPPAPTPAIPTATDLIPQLVQGIFYGEGHGTQLGVKYNNYGDLKFTAYTKSLGATGAGENNLAIFPSVTVGNAACLQLCLDAAHGLLPAYKGCTISGFVKIFADPPSQEAWDNYVAILLRFIGNKKVASSLLSSLI